MISLPMLLSFMPLLFAVTSSLICATGGSVSGRGACSDAAGGS